MEPLGASTPTGPTGSSCGSRSTGRRRRRHARRPPGGRAARRPVRGRPPGDPHRDPRPDRPRRRIRALGGRDGDRRDRPRHRSLRPAECRRGEGAHAGTPREARPSDAEVPQDDLPGAWSGSSETAVALPLSVPILATETPIVLVGDTPMQLTHGDGTAAGELRRHLARLRPSGYIALQAYIAPTPARDAAFARIRTLLRDATATLPRWATVRDSSIPPDSSTRAGRRPAGSSS